MDITAILAKILKSVYGKDVRNAIHDGIEACATKCTETETKTQNLITKCAETETKMQDLITKCADTETKVQGLEDKTRTEITSLHGKCTDLEAKCTDTETKVQEYAEKLDPYFKQSVDFETQTGGYWGVNHDRTITKYYGSLYLPYENAVIPVSEGEVYEIHCAKSGDGYRIEAPIIAVSNATASEADGIISIFENPTDGDDQYLVTVPEGAKFLLVSNVRKSHSGIDMEIYRKNDLNDMVEKVEQIRSAVNAEYKQIYRESHTFSDAAKLTVELDNMRHVLMFIRLDPGASVSNYGLISFYDESGNSKGTLAELGSAASGAASYRTAMIRFDFGNPVQFTRFGEQGGTGQMVVRNGSIGNYAAGTSQLEQFKLSKIMLPPITGTVDIAIYGY